MLNRSLRPVIAFVFLASTNPTWAYQSNDWGYQPSRMTDIPYNQNFNFQNKLQLNLDFLTRNIAPALDFNISSLRLPTFEIPDFGNQSWTFQKTNFSFLDDKRLSGLSGSFSLPNQNQISFDLKNFSYQSKLSAPQGFTQTFRDIQGQTLTKTRINQTSVPNPSFDNHRAYLQKNHPNLVSNTNAPYPAGLRPPPTKELVKEFQETWVMKSGEGRKEFKLNVAISDHDQNRWPKTFEGTVQRESGTIKFTASVPRDEYGRVKSAHITIEGKGTPKAEIRWNPKSTDTPDYEKGLKLLSENLPVPFLAGPRSATRINGADMPESPVKVSDSGFLKKDQLAPDRNLANLVGREELGISVGFSPSGAGSKAGFSLGNALRNLGYMITGRWSEVKSMRQELNGMQKQEPGKFVLSAGFNDPGLMGVNDLRGAIARSKELNLPQQKAEILAASIPEFKSFVDPKGRSISFDSPLKLKEKNGAYSLQEPVKYSSFELTKATFKVENDSLRMTEGVVKTKQDTFYVDSKGDFTDVKTFEQGLQKIETAQAHLTSHGERLTRKLAASMSVTNAYLENLHGVTGQILTSRIEMTNSFQAHSEQVASFSSDSMQMRESLQNEDYWRVQQGLPELHDSQMSLMKQEQVYGAQVAALGQFEEKLGALTGEMRDLLPKVEVDHMLSKPLSESAVQGNSGLYFVNDKIILSGKANDLLDNVAGLAEAGLVDRKTAKEWAAGIITARDRFMAAVPRMGYEIENTANQLKDPLKAMTHGANREADAMFFERWNRMIDKDPEGMAAFATKGLWVAKGLKIAGVASGLGLTGVGLIHAPVSMIAGFGSGLAAEKGLRAMGIEESPAKFYGGLTGFIVGLKTYNPATEARAINWVKGTWNKAGDLLSKVEFGLPGAKAIGKMLASERGVMLIEVPTSTRGAIRTVFPKGFATITTPQGPASQAHTPEALAARIKVDKGATLYRMGTIGKSQATEGQFWSLEHPLKPNYGHDYGVPTNNIAGADFIETAILKSGMPFITRPAPAHGSNPGGAIEVVVPKNGVNLQSFSTKGDKW